MKTLAASLAIFAIATAAVPAQAMDDDLTAKIQVNAPIYAILSPCHLRAIGAAVEHGAVLARANADPEAEALIGRLHRETQAAYLKAGNRLAFCKDFAAANSQYVKFRVTISAGVFASRANPRVRAAVAYNICGVGPAIKLSQTDKKGYEDIRLKLQTEHEIAKELAEVGGKNVAAELAAVTEQFCAARWTN
jgi:hypothetical protein